MEIIYRIASRVSVPGIHITIEKHTYSVYFDSGRRRITLDVILKYYVFIFDFMEPHWYMDLE